MKKEGRKKYKYIELIKEKNTTYHNKKPRKRNINANTITTSLLRYAKTQPTNITIH